MPEPDIRSARLHPEPSEYTAPTEAVKRKSSSKNHGRASRTARRTSLRTGPESAERETLLPAPPTRSIRPAPSAATPERYRPQSGTPGTQTPHQPTLFPAAWSPNPSRMHAAPGRPGRPCLPGRDGKDTRPPRARVLPRRRHRGACTPVRSSYRGRRPPAVDHLPAQHPVLNEKRKINVTMAAPLLRQVAAGGPQTHAG
jgi:hypothetical protein